ncbi:MAG: hypothetical protein Q9170_002384 [Blastenia crenularia]
MPSHPLPSTFTTLKSSILHSLSTPSASYTDASPKGTLDTAILPLIQRLNTLEGAVTTSSCAGRVSVFVEGRKPPGKGKGGTKGEKELGVNGIGEGDVEGVKRKVVDREKAVPGGKGMGGRWTFVSHDAVAVDEADDLMGKFGLRPGKGEAGRVGGSRKVGNERYVRFAFEPMILHIAAASLHHASPILSAAISAGFRESGVQSLKNLTDPNALPMVAVRSAGLAFESIIGVVHEGINASERLKDGWDSGQLEEEEVIETLVDGSYLKMLVGIANERFEANAQRIKRFEESLFSAKGDKQGDEWEDIEERKERKRREGLRKRGNVRASPEDGISNESLVEEDIGIGDLEGVT